MTQTQILISAAALEQKLGDPEWVAIDCRSDLRDPDAGREAYECGHIPGSIFLDLDADLASPIGPDTGRHPLPDASKLSDRLGGLGVASSNKLVVYDSSHGGFAARAWWILRWLGHEAVFLLDGGSNHWESQGLPIESTVVRRTPTSYAAQPDSSMIVTTRELEEDIEGIPGRNLLDARDGARFRGEQEPIDPVAGHVPGAVNAPFTQFVNREGIWRPLSDRVALMEGLLGSDRETSWSVMCGSGVTACHLAISGLEAGFSEPRVYVGSWSEWIRDANRPIATAPT